MDDMTIKKGTSSKLLGADLSKSFPGALYSPSKQAQGKPEPIPHPPNKPLSLLSKTDDDLQPLSWLVSPNLLHNVCGRPVQSKPPPPKKIIHRTANPSGKFSSMQSHFKLRPQPYHPPKKNFSVPAMKVRAIKVNGRLIKQEPGEFNRVYAPRSHPYKLVNRTRPTSSTRSFRSKYAKPPYSFATLIFMAIEESSAKKLPVKDIYNWIIDRFPYYQLCDRGWKNSVRHNLSLNRCFKRIDKDRRLECGKGSWWTVDPELRPELIQAFKKLGNVNMIPGPIGSENITPPTSPLFHTPPSSPTSVFNPSTTEEETAAEALCLMKRNAGTPRNSSDASNGTETPSTSNNPSSSESSPEQMPPLEQLPTKQPRTTRSSQGQKRSIIIDKKSADGVWALLEMAKGRPKSSK